MKVPEAYRRYAKRARRQGWTITWARNGHLVWRHPLGHAVRTAATPSDRRACLNVAADLRRAGLRDS